jgi:hypothetical protein
MTLTVIRRIGLIGILLLTLVLIEINPAWLASAANSVSRQISKDKDVVQNFESPESAVRICSSNQAPCKLTATPSRTRGTVSLSWRSNGVPFRGSFLVERSTNRRTWSAVSFCRKTPTTATSYYCSDSGLRSRTTYYYRACAVTTGFRCGTTNVTPVTSVRAP